MMNSEFTVLLAMTRWLVKELRLRYGSRILTACRHKDECLSFTPDTAPMRLLFHHFKATTFPFRDASQLNNSDIIYAQNLTWCLVSAGLLTK